MKIHKIHIEQRFEAPISQIWETFNQHALFGKMLGQNIVRVSDSTQPDNPDGVGSIRRIKLPFLSFEETVRKSEKNACIEYQITKGTPLHHHYGTMLFSENEKYGSKTALLNYTIELGSRFPLFAAALKIVLQKSIESSLKKYAEGLAKKTTNA